MFDLPVRETIIFGSAAAAYLAAAVVAIVQLFGWGRKCGRYLVPLVALGAVLEAVMLIFRAIAIKAIPLTGAYESLIVLTIVFALIYLLLSMAIDRVWFGSVMAWLICCLVVLAASIAEPASAAREAASTPWAIAHGIAMILGSASLMAATASAVLYLLGRRKLKQKKVAAVLGRLPNIEKLKRMNFWGLKSCFVLMTFGLASGVGLSASIGRTARDLVTDSKIVLITAVWVLLGLLLALSRTGRLKEKTIAYATIVASALILFAVAGTLVFCGTWHVF